MPACYGFSVRLWFLGPLSQVLLLTFACASATVGPSMAERPVRHTTLASPISPQSQPEHTREPSAAGAPPTEAVVDEAPSHELDGATPISRVLTVTTERVAFEGYRECPSGAVARAVADEQLQIWNIGGRSDSAYISNRDGYHPGTRVRIDAYPARRSRIAQARAPRIQAGLRNRGYWPMRNCYESTARDQADPGGKTWFRVSISARGTLSFARILKTELRHREIARCQAAALRDLKLEPTGSRMDLDVAVSVWPGDVSLLQLPKALDRNGGVDLARLSGLVETLEGSVSECMQQARLRDPKLWGRLALSFVVKQGRPSRVREEQSHFGDASAVECVVEQLRSLDVPDTIPDELRLVAAWRLPRPEAASPPNTSEPNGNDVSGGLQAATPPENAQ